MTLDYTEDDISNYWFVNGSTLYFENYEVVRMLMTVAVAGPSAMYALLIGLGSISLGPIGNTVAVVLGLIGHHL